MTTDDYDARKPIDYAAVRDVWEAEEADLADEVERAEARADHARDVARTAAEASDAAERNLAQKRAELSRVRADLARFDAEHPQ